jgi:hypothetical protein
MKTVIALASIAVLGVTLTGCIEVTPSSDEVDK